MKKSIWDLILSIGQLVIGSLAIVSFVLIATSGQEIIKWIPALILGIVLILLGIIGIKAYRSKE